MKTARMTLAQKHKWAGFFFSLPFIIGFILFFLTPLARSLYYSFCEITMTAEGIAFNFKGWEHYHQLLFVNPDINRLIVQTLKDFAFIFPAILLYALFIAVVLNAKFRGRLLFRIIFFIPIIINSGFVLTNINDAFSNGIAGMLNGQSADASTVNITQAILQFLPLSDSSFVTVINDYVMKINSIINMSGIQILVYLAGLQTISPSIYEASNIEGASSWDNFWKITLPMMSPFILVNAIFTIIDQLAGQSNPVILFIRSIVYQGSLNLGAAFSLSWIYLPIIIVIIGVVALVINRFVHYENN